MLLPTQIDFLQLQSNRRGARGGVVFRDTHFSFARLADAAARLATQVTAAGIGGNDRVILCVGNSPALLAASYGVWAVGATTVPASTRSTEAELSHLAHHARARLLLCDPERADLAAAVARNTGIAAASIDAAADAPTVSIRRAASKPVASTLALTPQRLAVLAYTSGTTGQPKGVMLSHSNLHWSTLACAGARGDTEDSVGACLSPLTHTPVFVSHLLCRVALGQTAVLLEKFDVDAVLDATERHGITDLPLIAGMVFSIAELGQVKEGQRRTVRKVSVGGAATPMEAKRKLSEIYPDAEVIEAYGQSESTNGVSMARGASVFDRPGTVGKTNPFVCVRTRRADGTFAEVDEEGEIVIGGPTVMRGYYRDRRATAAQIRDGWLHTGDLGRQDGAGYLYITGRVKELIITGGENVSPVEVENVLRRHADIADVAVIGTPHPRWGEQVTAIVVLRPNATRDDDALTAYAGEHLAGFKKPRRIEYVDQLPRNAANKVQTGLLKDMFARKES